MTVVSRSAARLPALTARQAERRLVLLTATRWLPVGVVFGLTVLLPLERGLDLAEVGMLLSIQGFVVLGLELPTGGLADAVGRRPLLVVSGLVAMGSTTLVILAQGFWMFALALVLQGVFRALDSGPLEAWYVDAAQAHDEDHRIERGLSRASTMLGVAIAAGALIGGGLVAWHPTALVPALVLPFVVAGALYGLHTVLLVALVREPARSASAGAAVAAQRTVVAGAAHVRARRAAAAVARAARDMPGTVIRGLALLGTSRVLRAIVLVEVFWSVAMIAFETLTPVQLASQLGGEEPAAALFGPASAAAWGLFAGGAVLAGILSRGLGVVRTAIAARLLNGGFVVLMGLAAGPAGLLAGFGLAYLSHGAAGPMHSTLLHREADPSNRAVVLSMNSMVAGGSYSLGLLALAPLAGATSPGVAFVVAGCFSLLGALCYLPALRREREANGSIGAGERIV